MFKKLASLAAIGALFCAAPALAQDVSPDALRGKSILFVVGDLGKDQPNDDALIRAHLETQGARVTLARAGDAADAARGADLVLISSTVPARELRDRYRSVSVPRRVSRVCSMRLSNCRCRA